MRTLIKARHLIEKIGDFLETTLKVWQIIIFSISIFSINYEVLMRYVFNCPSSWSEELSRFSMVWLVLLGLGIGVRKKEHIRVDTIINSCSETIQIIAAWLRYIFVSIFTIVLIIYGIKLVFITSKQITPGLGINKALVYLSVPIGAILIFIYLLELILKGYKDTF